MSGDAPNGQVYVLYGSGDGQYEYLSVVNGVIVNATPRNLFLDSGPFFLYAANLLRDAGFNLFTCDGSPHGAIYRHAGPVGEVQDVPLVPADWLNENEEIKEEIDIQTVYQIRFLPSDQVAGADAAGDGRPAAAGADAAGDGRPAAAVAGASPCDLTVFMH